MNVFDALIQQESSGRPGIRGQQTQYGVPLGMTQMLPATAQEMAGKLGVPWRPDLMTGTTPDAASYQKRLGQAYYQQGLNATGNVRDALRYYHGGPDRSMWGPKTNAYADSVLARMNGGSQVAPRKARTLADIAAPDYSPQPVNVLGDMSQMSQPQGLTLGDLAGLPQGNIPKPNNTGKILGNIAGVLGDALMAYGGLSPQFGPGLRKQAEDEADRSFDREKLNASLELARQKALAPPQWLQDAETFQGLPQSQKDAVLGYQDAVHPIFTATPMGTQLNRRLNTRSINGQTYYLVNGEWYDNPEGN